MATIENVFKNIADSQSKGKKSNAIGRTKKLVAQAIPNLIKYHAQWDKYTDQFNNIDDILTKALPILNDADWAQYISSYVYEAIINTGNFSIGDNINTLLRTLAKSEAMTSDIALTLIFLYCKNVQCYGSNDYKTTYTALEKRLGDTYTLSQYFVQRDDQTNCYITDKDNQKIDTATIVQAINNELKGARDSAYNRLWFLRRHRFCAASNS